MTQKPCYSVRFFDVLPLVTALLQRELRVTYSALQYAFGFDDTFMDVLKKELIFKRVAVDENGEGLVWVGQRQPTVVPMLSSPVPEPATTDGILTVTSDNGFPAAPDILATAPPHLPTMATELVRIPDAERRHLTVMFCDLVGSTSLSGKFDPEDLREIVRAYQKTAAKVIQHYDGHVAQLLGDGLLVYFGFPRAHEDDAQRAVYTGLGIIEAMGQLNTRLEREKNVRLAVRLGIHTGPAVVGEMGGSGRQEQLALGETPNIAARLEALAGPNTVVMSASTARLVQGVFALEELGMHTLKGVDAPIRVSRILGPLEGQHGEEATGCGGAVFLVGRDEEVGLLRRRWEQSKEGLGQVVLISGEAGIGKSALLEGLRTHVQQEGYTRITFRCSPYHTNSALYPVIVHVQRVLRLDSSDVHDVQLQKLEGVLRTYELPLGEVIPLFAALLSLPLPVERYATLSLTPPQQKQQTLDALVAWLSEEADRRPVLAVWEDLHWADPSTLELLGLLVDQAPTAPMLHVLTFRPEFAPPWAMRSHMTPMTLNRLERPQVEAIIAHLAGAKALPTDVVEHIVTKTDGVPLFVEELTKMLLESTLLRDEGNHYALTGPLSTLAIPATLQDSLMARLDRLPTVRVVAQLGAVLGREFAYETLQALEVMDDATLQEGLAQLVAADLLYQRGRPPRARYIFKHALVQDAAYTSLLRSTRYQYHQQIAQLLETRFPDTAATQPDLLAHHYTEAGCSDQALAYWHRAGQRAKERSAHVEALGHLARGLEILQDLPDTAERRRHELEFQIERGLALIVTRGQAAPDVGQAYTRARDLCQQVEDTPQLFRVLWGLWHFHVVRAELHTVQELGEQLLSLAQGMADPGYLLGGNYVMGGGLSCLGAFAAAREYWEQNIALYESHPLSTHIALYGSDLGVFSLSWAPHVLWHLGYPEQARRMSQKAVALAQQLGHPYSLALSLDYAAMLHQFCREPATTYKQAEAAMAVCAEQGFAYYQAWGMLLRGWALFAQGSHADGIVQMQKGLHALRATGASLRLPSYLALLAEAYGTTGRIADGLALLSEALTATQVTGEVWREAELHRLQGELLLQQAVPDTVQAEQCFHRALGIVRSQHAKSLELRAAISLSRLWQQQGKCDAARGMLADVYHWFTEGFDTLDLQEARALLATLA